MSDHSVIVDNLGTDWVCEATAIKPYPACRLTHGAIDLASAIQRGRGGRSVGSIQLDISLLSYNIVGIRAPNKVHPQNNVDAQFSAYFQTAVTWLDGSDSGWGAYDRLLDSDMSELLEKISIRSDNELSDLNTRMTVKYEDSTIQSEFCAAPLGEPSNPISIENVRKKYLSLAIPVLGTKKTKVIKNAIMILESVNVVDIIALLA
jgi:2-methylcitrate dehydratase PrpD